MTGMELYRHLVYDHGKSPVMMKWMRESERVHLHAELNCEQRDDA